MLSTLVTTFSLVGLYFLLIIFIPGLLLTANLTLNRLNRTAIAIVTGLSVFSLSLYTLRFFELPFFLLELALITVSLIFLIKYRPQFHLPEFSTANLSFILLAILIAMIQGAVLIRSGILIEEGIRFVDLSFHDSTQHLSLIKRLWTNTDIVHPGFSGEILTNYHYLIDLVLAAPTRFSFISLLDTYYRFYPLAISFVFSLSLYAFTSHLTKNRQFALAAVIFTIFSGNASFFAQFIRGPEFSWGSNSFIINPLVDLLQNPASIFVLAQTLIVIFLVNLYSQTNSIGRKQHLLGLTFLIASTMIGYKAWGGLLILAALAATAGYSLIFQKDLKPTICLIATLLVSLFLFLPHYDAATSSSPVWAPGWTLTSMVNDADRWNKIEEIFLIQDFKARGLIYPQIKLYTKWTLIYIIGNYWTRILGLLAIAALVLRPHKIKAWHITVLTITTLSLFLPLFFNQGRMTYDIEQFSPYAILLASIFTITTLYQLHLKFKPGYLFVLIVILVLIIISIPSNYTSLRDRITGSTFTIPQEYFNTYNLVTQNTSPKAVILLSPSHRNTSTLRFAAFTNRNTFYSGRTLSVISGADFQTRQQQVDNFFRRNNPREQQELVENYSITHLFLYAEDSKDFKPKIEAIEQVFTTDAGTLYRFTL